MLLITKEMHPLKKKLVVSSTLSLHVSLMDIHHDTSFRSILEDDSISLASGIHICSCSDKRVGLLLIIRPSIRSFCITHFTFTSTFCFHFNLV
jgi:hypothetical protein